MKIALANNYYYLRGGSERVLFGDQEALQAAGHEVRPFAHHDERNSPTTSSSFFPDVATYATATGTGKFKAALDIVYSTAAGKAFGAFLDDFRPDVVHCHNIYGRLTTAILDEAKQRNTPTVLTLHDLKLVCPAYIGLREGQPCQLCQDGGYWRCVRYKCHKQNRAASAVYAAESYFNRLAGKYDSVARFLCPSRFMQRSIIGAGIAEERTTYHPNALPLQQYQPSFEPGDYALYAGRLSTEKGIWTMLAAFETSNIPLRIAGTGPLEAEISARVQKRGLLVQMEGYSAGKHLADLYRNAAFTVVPSEWQENAPMAILESFAYGKPVLAANIGGIPELFADGGAGRLFPPGNIELLAKAATEMWSNKAETRKMGEQGRRLADTRFSQETRLNALLAIYASVCNHNPIPHADSPAH